MARLVVVGYDGWTESVLAELAGLDDVEYTVVVEEERGVRERLVGDGHAVVTCAEVDAATMREAGVEGADGVLVATLDDQLNVLAVLTIRNVDESVPVVTFAGEDRDVPKLEAAGADTVLSLGQVVGELIVEVAITGRSSEQVLLELLELID